MSGKPDVPKLASPSGAGGDKSGWGDLKSLSGLKEFLSPRSKKVVDSRRSNPSVFTNSKLGLDRTLQWIQNTVYDRGGTRGALFHLWEEKRKTAQFLFVMLAELGLALGLLHYYIVNDPDLPPSEDLHFMDQCFKWGVLFTSIITLLFWYRLYSIKARLHALTSFNDKEVSNPGFNEKLSLTGMTPVGWHRAGVLGLALADLFILIPQPLPFFDVKIAIYEFGLKIEHKYPLDSLLLLAMFLRLAFIPRCLADFSVLSTPHSKAIANLNFVNVSPSMVMRTFLGESIPAVMTFFLTLVCVFSFMMMIAELPMKGSMLHHSFPNCMWLVFITMTTVGYGDVYPNTKLGRAVAVSASFAAVVCMALFVNLATSRLSLTRKEEKVVAVVGRLHNSKQLRVAAAGCVQSLWKAYNKRRKKAVTAQRESSSERTPLVLPPKIAITFDRKVAASVREFRETRRSYISDCLDVEHETALSALQAELSMRLNFVDRKTSAVMDRVATLEDNVNTKLEAILRAVEKKK